MVCFCVFILNFEVVCFVCLETKLISCKLRITISGDVIYLFIYLFFEVASFVDQKIGAKVALFSHVLVFFFFFFFFVVQTTFPLQENMVFAS